MSSDETSILILLLFIILIIALIYEIKVMPNFISKLGDQMNGQENMHEVSCPKCNSLVKRADYPNWVIWVAICFFPVGLLAVLTGREHTSCNKCGFKWRV